MATPNGGTSADTLKPDLCDVKGSRVQHQFRIAEQDNGDVWFYCINCWAHCLAPTYEEMLSEELEAEKKVPVGRYAASANSAHEETHEDIYLAYVEALRKFHTKKLHHFTVG